MCLPSLTVCSNINVSAQFDGVHVVSGSLDTSIRVWDVETGVCKHALMGHQSLTSGRRTIKEILLQNSELLHLP